MHDQLDAGPANGMALGRRYADVERLLDVGVRRTTWEVTIRDYLADRFLGADRRRTGT
jgi:hypothetical protein